MVTRRHRGIAAPGSLGAWLVVAGVALLAIHGVMLAISPRFAYGQWPAQAGWPTTLLVTLMMLAGVLYLATVWRLLRAPVLGRAGWLWVIGVGLGLRALMLPSTPMLETDYFRYLWDGAVLAHGHNPYVHAPRDVLQGHGPAELVELGEAADPVLERVNHPWLTTIYPPTAQVGFAVGYAIMPWRIEGLRITWLLLDLLTLGLLLGLLRHLALPLAAVLIYWWNPLLIKEGYNTAHMEMTLLPCIAAALWLAVRVRLIAASLTLAAAVGAKLWPVLLLPALLRQAGPRGRRLAVAASVFAVASAVVVAPMLLSHMDETAGVRAYATTWQVNASLYQGLHLLGGYVMPDDPRTAGRLMLGAIVLAWGAWLCRRPAADGFRGRAVCERALWIVAALFLLSPTQLPWYWLWLLPMLVVRPSPGLLLLTATLPMYYLRFPLRELGYSAWFNHGVVWLEFGPALLLLAWEAWRRWFVTGSGAPSHHPSRRPHPEQAEVGS